MFISTGYVKCIHAFLSILLSFQMHENVFEPCFTYENLWIIMRSSCMYIMWFKVLHTTVFGWRLNVVGICMWACVFFLFLGLTKKNLDNIHEYTLSLNRRKAWMCLQRLFSWFYLVPVWNLGNWTLTCQYVLWQKPSRYPLGKVVGSVFETLTDWVNNISISFIITRED